MDSLSKIKTRDALTAVRADLAAQGQVVVFTNGCFDILHRGHVEYLEKARQCGDALVIGLNSDDSVRRLKGAYRPLVPEADRAFLLTAREGPRVPSREHTTFRPTAPTRAKERPRDPDHSPPHLPACPGVHHRRRRRPRPHQGRRAAR